MPAEPSTQAYLSRESDRSAVHGYYAAVEGIGQEAVFKAIIDCRGKIERRTSTVLAQNDWGKGNSSSLSYPLIQGILSLSLHLSC